jgi:hypothetical protein
MAGKIQVKRIILLPLLSILAIAGWILAYFGGFNFPSQRNRVLSANEKMVHLQKHLEDAVIEERQGIILGFLGVCAFVPLILFGGFPSWAYVSACIFIVLGYAAMFHGNHRKLNIKGQLYCMSNIGSVVR